MALKFNSTTISPSYTPKFNSTALKSVKYGSTEVWKKELTIYNNGTEGVALHTYLTDFSPYPIDYSVGEAKKNSGNIKLSAPSAYGNSGGVAGFHTGSKVNVSDYSKITVVLSGGSYGNDGTLECNDSNHIIIGLTAGANMGSRNLGTCAEGGYKDLNNGVGGTSKRTVTWDITNKTGSWYINVQALSYRLYNYQNSMTIYSIILS